MAAENRRRIAIALLLLLAASIAAAAAAPARLDVHVRDGSPLITVTLPRTMPPGDSPAMNALVPSAMGWC